jgi:hypothetical protein
LSTTFQQVKTPLSRTFRRYPPDGVNWVSRSLSTRPIKTELLGIVIDATGDEVILSGSDLETSSKSFFKADILDNLESAGSRKVARGNFVAPFQINQSQSHFRWNTSSCYIRCSKVHTANSVNLMNIQTLPELPETTGVVASDVLQQLLHKLQSLQGAMIHYQHLPAYILKSTKRPSPLLQQIATV